MRVLSGTMTVLNPKRKKKSEVKIEAARNAAYKQDYVPVGAFTVIFLDLYVCTGPSTGLTFLFLFHLPLTVSRRRFLIQAFHLFFLSFVCASGRLKVFC